MLPQPINSDLPIVQFKDVEKTYDGESLAVRRLTLDVRRGEFLTLLGPSGSGKTTTLMMVAGFEAPTSGDIRLDGRSINELPPYKRGIGVVFQNYALFPHMTVAENLAFPLKVQRVPRAKIAEKVKAMLELVRLPNFGNRRPGQLSGGQQQRVAFARALVFGPKLVLMDEPLGALDRQLREAMQFEIRHIHKTLGVTVIYVTHDQGEALTMSDRIAVFNGGEVEQLADPEELYERPRTNFVARFVGENNCLRGRTRDLAPDRCVIDVGGVLIQAVPVNVTSVGGEAILSLRPERVMIAPVDGPSKSKFEAVVQEIIYIGDHVRVRLAFAGTENFIVKLPAVFDRRPISAGEKVTIGWELKDCRALDGSNLS